jgi:hypothetical protein
MIPRRDALRVVVDLANSRKPYVVAHLTLGDDKNPAIVICRGGLGNVDAEVLNSYVLDGKGT